MRAFFAFLIAASLALPAVAEAKPRELTLADVEAAPPSLMVAKKVSVPLVLVVDPARLPALWEANKKYSVKDWDLFVSRDVKKALDTYFDTVLVQGPADARPDGRYLQADVKIDRVQFRPINTGGLIYNVIEMTWGFGIRFSDADEYLFSYAGIANSKETYQTAWVGLGQVVEDAVTGLLAAWSEKEVMDALHKGANPAPAEPPAP